MSDLPDWAQDRAREFQGKMCRCPEKRVQDAAECPDCLAELLVEVSDRNTRAAADGTAKALLAEVRRVVGEELVRSCGCAVRILARLEKL